MSVQGIRDVRRLDPDVLAERRDGWRVELDLRIPVDLAVFAGHFPGLPVVPGVLQIDWVMRFASTRFDVVAMTGAPAIKFSKLLCPGDRCTLTLEEGTDRDTLSFALRDGDATFAAGRLSVRRR